MKMSKMRKSKFVVEASYGSDFQKEFGDETIEGILGVIIGNIQSRHKKNKVYFTCIK